MKVVVWGRNCSACFDCEAELGKLGVEFERGDLNFVLAGTWVSEVHPDSERLMNVAAVYVQHHRMPVLEVDGKFGPYPDAMALVKGVDKCV